MHVDGYRAEIEFQSCAISDGILERILGDVSVLVLVGSKGGEGVVVVPVNRGASQTEEERIRQRSAHLLPQVSLLRPMRFVHQKNDIVAGVDDFSGIQVSELEDGGNENLALTDLGLQLLLGSDVLYIWNLRPGKVSGNLVF